MRYVPNLIPAHSKVLPDYFKGNLYEPPPGNKAMQVIMCLLAVAFMLAALTFLPHFTLFLIFGLIGIILLPSGHQFIERKLCFNLTPKIKAALLGLLLVPSVPLMSHYNAIDKQLADQRKLQDEQTARAADLVKYKEAQRRDSFNYFIKESRQLTERHELAQAGVLLGRASAFAATQDETGLLEQEKVAIASINTSDLMKAGKYQAALSEMDHLISADPSNADFLYSRAICYSKTGKIREAVNDLEPLLKAGNENAEKLYNKINPVRRRIVGYETLCCDGTTSGARGRGACSHNGGVCDWNHPVYEEYRKYE